MGVGYAANFILAVEKEKLEKFKSYQELLAGLKKYDVPLENFAQAIESDDVIYNNNNYDLTKEEMQELDTLYESFQNEFKQVTGVEINIGYHDPDNDGDRYDQVNGVFFGLDFGDMYELTPDGKKVQDTLGFEWKFFVTFG